jgi:hypothetical protein
MDKTKKHPLYRRWKHMINRCHNPKAEGYKRYGGTGICVCDKWRKDFNAFLKDVGMPKNPTDTLDRINPHGNYEPDNIRWADRTTQQRNRRDNIKVQYKGEERLLIELAEEHNIKYDTVRTRMFARGWDVEKALTEPVHINQKTYKYKGKNYTLGELAKLTNMTSNAIKYRINRGWSVEQAVERPSGYKTKKNLGG